jgi:lysophospholipase L1-like esterase
MTAVEARPPVSSRTKLVGGLLLGAFGIAAALVVAEGALRITGFEHRPYPVVQFGWPDPKTIADYYQADPDLVWVRRDYQQILADARARRPAVAFMGDSCTEFGTYPRRALEHLATDHPALARGVVMGVGGWSVVQGWRQLERDVLPLQPRVVTVYFGWNDHWIALGPPDDELRRARIASWLAERSRIVQLLYRISAGRGGAERPNRVPLPTYEATLERMVDAVRNAGGATVLITAPSAHVRGREPQYLLARHVRRLDDLVPTHQAYVEATRRAARDARAELCDAAAAFEKLPPPREQYFLRDGIHLTEAGDVAMASLVAGCVARADERSLPTR